MGVKFGMEEGTFGPLLHAKFHPHRCNVSPLRGEKPQNWLLCKLNTGRFALRAMLPVMIPRGLRLPRVTFLCHSRCSWLISHDGTIAGVCQPRPRDLRFVQMSLVCRSPVTRQEQDCLQAASHTAATIGCAYRLI